MSHTHVTDDEITRFRARQLSPEGIVAFTDHLATCEHCRLRTAAAAPALTPATLLDDNVGLGEDAHVPELALHAYVDGTTDLAQAAAIAEHLAVCAQCTGEVDDLRAFIARTRPPARRTWYYGLAAAAVLVVGLVYGVASRLPQTSSVVATVIDGDRTITLDSRGALRGAGSIVPELEASVRESLLNGRLSIPTTVLALGGVPGALRGASETEAFKLSQPVGTAVSTDHPTFRWTPTPSALSYVVTVQDERSGETVSSPILLGTEWTAEGPLARGAVYTWQVSFRHRDGTERVVPEPPAPPARFSVLTASEAGVLSSLPPSHLIRGVAYANVGLLDDAQREFETLATTNAGSELVDRLLAQVDAARR